MGWRHFGLTDTQRLGRHRRASPQMIRPPARRRKRLIATITVACTLAAIGVTLATLSGWRFGLGTPAKPHNDDTLPATPSSYIGLYVHSVQLIFRCPGIRGGYRRKT